MWHLFAHLLLWRESGESLGVFALGAWSLLRWYFAWQVLFFLVFRDRGKPTPTSLPSLLLVYKVNTLEEGFSPPECTWRGLLAAWHKWEISKLTSASSKYFYWQPFCLEYCGTELWLLSFTSGADLIRVFSRKNNHESVALTPHLVIRSYWTFGPLETAFFSQLRQSGYGAWRNETSSPDVLCNQAFVSLALLRYSLHIPKPTIGSVHSSVIFSEFIELHHCYAIQCENFSITLPSRLPQACLQSSPTATSSPRRPLVCFWRHVCLSWTLHVRGIIQYVIICIWLLSLASRSWGSPMCQYVVPFHCCSLL